MLKPILHIFIHTGNARTLCGIKDKNGIAYNNTKPTCKKCKIIRKQVIAP